MKIKVKGVVKVNKISNPTYDRVAFEELSCWKLKMNKKPSIFDKVSKGAQNKINNILPNAYHQAITFAIKNAVKAVVFGSEFVAKQPTKGLCLKEIELMVEDKKRTYKRIALVEGGYTGFGGILLGLADVPLLLSIKIKFLYDVAALYGYDVNDYKERIYILNIIQLAFSSKGKRRKVFKRMETFDAYCDILPENLEHFEWRSFQQEYRDYLDLAKLFQMVPGVGAVVGAYVNSKFMDELGDAAKMAYRMRKFI